MHSDDEFGNVVSKFGNVTVHDTMYEQNAAFARQAAERARAEAARAAARAKTEALNYTKSLISKYNLTADADRVFKIHGPEIKKIKDFLENQANTKASLSRASTNSFLTKIIKPSSTKPSTKPSIVPTKHYTVRKGDMYGGNKSRRNTRTYRHSKKHKRVRHTRRKRTRRNHRSRRHR